MRDKDYGRGRRGRVVCGRFQDRNERASALTPDRGKPGDSNHKYCGGYPDQAEIKVVCGFKQRLEAQTAAIHFVGWSLILIGAALIL